MKQLLSMMAMLALCCCISCNDQKTASESNDNPEQKKNLDANHVIASSFESGDVSKIDSVVADDFIDHTDRGDVKGRDSLKAMIKSVRETNKDMKMETVKEATDGDYVFGWYRYKGTSDGSMGMPAGPYDFEAIEVSRYKDGKAVEHWSFMQPKDMMKMMPAPATSNNPPMVTKPKEK
jgi:predicted SnoaL-like aldol condensation-catalyzing enzyme